jgi:hypothetical protein
MTYMIYRGVKHNKQRSTKVRMTKNLIYRGVAHDGMSAAPVARSLGAVMCYRGVRYTVQADGTISGIDLATSSVGSGAVEMQTA